MSKGPWQRRSKYGLTELEHSQIPLEYLGCDGELDPRRITPTAPNLLFKTMSLGHAWSGLPLGVAASAVNPSRALKEMEKAGFILWRLVGADGLIAFYRDKDFIVKAGREHRAKKARKPRQR
jgi:hypothetical protein